MIKKNVPIPEAQEQLTPSQPEFLNTKRTLSRWGVSKFYLYGLVSRNIILKYYFEFDPLTGRGKGKPFYEQGSIRRALSPEQKQ